MFLFYLSASVLVRCYPQAGVLLAVPLLYMLSFSYAYGRVLMMRQEMEKTISFNLSYDVFSRVELRKVKKFHLQDDDSGWLPAAQGTLAVMPGIDDIMGLGAAVSSAALLRVGMDNVEDADESYLSKDKLDDFGMPVVNNKFYDIYLGGEEGLIMMKQIKP